MITETPVIPPRFCHTSLPVAFSALNSALVRPPLGRPFVKTARGGPWGSHAVARPLLRCLGQHLLRIQLIDTPTVEFRSTTLEKGSNRLNWSCLFGMINLICFFLYLFLEVAIGNWDSKTIDSPMADRGQYAESSHEQMSGLNGCSTVMVRSFTSYIEVSEITLFMIIYGMIIPFVAIK